MGNEICEMAEKKDMKTTQKTLENGIICIRPIKCFIMRGNFNVIIIWTNFIFRHKFNLISFTVKFYLTSLDVGVNFNGDFEVKI